VYIGIIVRKLWCPKGGEIAIYSPLCDQCVACDMSPFPCRRVRPTWCLALTEIPDP
jgi:hypothetical protein